MTNNLPDVRTLARDDLEQLRVEIVAEQARLERLDSAPGELQYTVRTYLIDGGDVAEVRRVVDLGIAEAGAMTDEQEGP